METFFLKKPFSENLIKNGEEESKEREMKVRGERKEYIERIKLRGKGIRERERDRKGEGKKERQRDRTF
jgi:hypothetical protein